MRVRVSVRMDVTLRPHLDPDLDLGPMFLPLIFVVVVRVPRRRPGKIMPLCLTAVVVIVVVAVVVRVVRVVRMVGLMQIICPAL